MLLNTRRTFLQLSAAGAGLALLADFPGCNRAADALRPDLRLAVLNDTHYNDEHCAPYFTSLVKKLNASDLDAVLIVGDLTQSGTKEQFKEFKDILAQLKPPLKTVIGNHDFANDLDPDDPLGPRLNVRNDTYVAAFPNAINYTFDLAGWQFLALDSCDGINWQKVVAGKPMFEFLDATLVKLEKKKPAIVFTHFPLGKQDKNNYPGSRLANADDLLARLIDHNIRAVFNGHFHGRTERPWNAGDITTGPACSFFTPNHDGTKTKGYYLVTCKDGKLAREFIDFTPADPAATATAPAKQRGIDVPVDVRGRGPQEPENAS